jgi:DNA-binding response OmpR family regulator
MNRTVGKQEPERLRNTLGVDGRAYDILLGKLESCGANTDEPEADPRRIYTRLAFNEPLVRVQIEDESKVKREMVLACRNISHGGVGLLHSSFMYPGTTATVFLRRTDGKSPGVRGKVVRVQHRGGVVHEIGVRFDKEINPRDYINADFTQAVPSFEKVAPERLLGEVVVAVSDPGLAASIGELLSQTGLKLPFVSTVAGTVEACHKAVDMVLVELDFNGMSGPELVKKLRVNGLQRPVALLGDPGDGIGLSVVRVCGADALVRTPLTRDGLLRVLGDFMLRAWDPDQLDRSRSKVSRATLGELCAELQRLGIELDAQVKAHDRVSIFATCQRIRALATLVGMNGVASMAERLGERAATDEAPGAMQDLIEQIGLGCAAAGRAVAA